MRTKIDNIFPVLPSECDYLCRYRPCFGRDFDKGSFTQGRGYTSYRKEPLLVCRTRFFKGCPIEGGLKPPIKLDKLKEVIQKVSFKTAVQQRAIQDMFLVLEYQEKCFQKMAEELEKEKTNASM